MMKQSILNFVADNPNASSSEIAEAVGCSSGYVRFVFCRMRIYRKIDRKQEKVTADVVSFNLTPEMLREFVPAARRRGIGVAELFWRANQRMATDRILEAVLDDEAA